MKIECENTIRRLNLQNLHKQNVKRGHMCLQKKQKKKKNHRPAKIGNVLFAKPHPKYEYANLQVAYQEKNILTFNHLMVLMYCFARRTEKNLQKQQKVLPVSPNLFQPLSQVLLSQHPLLLTILLFGIVSNLNLHVNKFF